MYNEEFVQKAAFHMWFIPTYTRGFLLIISREFGSSEAHKLTDS